MKHSINYPKYALPVHLRPLFSDLHVLLAIAEQLENQTYLQSKHPAGKVNLDQQTKKIEQ